MKFKWPPTDNLFHCWIWGPQVVTMKTIHLSWTYFIAPFVHDLLCLHMRDMWAEFPFKVLDEVKTDKL
jgi:hypothetical protein